MMGATSSFAAALAVVSLSFCMSAHGAARPDGDAGTYPTKPIRLLVGFPPGGGNDALARVVGPRLAEKLGKPIVIDNRPGAGGNLAADMTAKAPADGYTILIASSTHPIAGLLKKDLPYDPQKDFAGVSQLVVYRSLLVVYPGFPGKTVKDLIAAAKAKPGQINFVSSGNGTGSHLAGELFKVAAQVDMTHVPYKGGAQAALDLVAGRVETMFSPLVPVLAHIKAGRLRPVAVTSLNRSRLLPELPTISDAGVPGYEFVSWYGILAPAVTPRAVVSKLNGALNDVMRQPEVTERAHAEDMDVMDTTPAQFDQVRRAMIVKWDKIIKATGIEGS
jgi:tripartite-type tricarboxylate transporter receptor subunit TctC